MKNQSGFSLLEILVALSLIGILGTTIPQAIVGANRATISTNQLTVAESLARSQMDYIQSQPYDSANVPPYYTVIPDIPDSYSIVTPMAERLDPRGDGTDSDDGLQYITVSVQRDDTVIFTLNDYKVNFHP